MAIALSAERAVGGRFGPYGGRYVPETLVAALDDLAALYDGVRGDRAFWAEYEALLAEFVGRPSPLTEAPRLGAEAGTTVVLKREDLNHTGAHKINNTIGQALLALRMGKRRIIAETGAGQHGVATATVCARFGLECVVYMGAEDVERQALNVYRMQLLGATVVPVESGTRTLKDAHQRGACATGSPTSPTRTTSSARWSGPHPYPAHGARLPVGHRPRGARADAGALRPAARTRWSPASAAARNAMGIFTGFLDDADVRLVGVEAAGEGIASGHHAPRSARARPGVLHGSLQLPAAGRGRPGRAGPLGLGRARLSGRRPGAQLSAGHRPGELRVGHRRRGARRVPGGQPARGDHSRARDRARLRLRAAAWPAAGRADALVLVCLSGRGDKDVAHVAALLGAPV